MAIRIKPIEGTYKTKVTYFTPAPGANAKQEEQTFLGEFKRLKTSEVKELRDSGKADIDMLCEVMTGWEATEIGSTEQIPFSEEILRQVADQTPGFAATCILRFLDTVGASRQKN